jgi:hypothetical protein
MPSIDQPEVGRDSRNLNIDSLGLQNLGSPESPKAL